MTDQELADILIERLNAQIQEPSVRKDVERLIETRIPVSKATADHPTVQVESVGSSFSMGFLGLLNGIVGTLPDGEKKGYGYITAVYNDNNELTNFKRTT